MGFRLEEGPAFTMHYKCSILGTDGLVIHEFPQGTNDFRKPPVELNAVGTGASFKLTATDKAGAVRHHKSWTLNTEP
jgi:hypothetical protein